MLANGASAGVDTETRLLVAKPGFFFLSAARRKLRALSELDCHLGYTVMRQVSVALAERLGFARAQLAACG